MTFKGDTIVGKPTLAMVEIYIAEKGLFCDGLTKYNRWSAQDLYNLIEKLKGNQ